MAQQPLQGHGGGKHVGDGLSEGFGTLRRDLHFPFERAAKLEGRRSGEHMAEMLFEGSGPVGSCASAAPVRAGRVRARRRARRRIGRAISRCADSRDRAAVAGGRSAPSSNQRTATRDTQPPREPPHRGGAIAKK